MILPALAFILLTLVLVWATRSKRYEKDLKKQAEKFGFEEDEPYR